MVHRPLLLAPLPARSDARLVHTTANANGEAQPALLEVQDGRSSQ